MSSPSGLRMCHVPNCFFLFFIFWKDFIFFSYYIQHCFICRPSDSTVPTDAGIEPRTVATGALAIRRSNHQARSHPRLGQISSAVGQISSAVGQISSATRLDLIRNQARSHPQLDQISSALGQISSATRLDLMISSALVQITIRTRLDLIRKLLSLFTIASSQLLYLKMSGHQTLSL